MKKTLILNSQQVISEIQFSLILQRLHSSYVTLHANYICWLALQACIELSITFYEHLDLFSDFV